MFAKLTQPPITEEFDFLQIQRKGFTIKYNVHYFISDGTKGLNIQYEKIKFVTQNKSIKNNTISKSNAIFKVLFNANKHS